MDGTKPTRSPTPFRTFLTDLSTIIPPFTLIGAHQRGGRALLINIIVAAMFTAFAWAMIHATGNVPQWSAVSLGFYAVFSWASTLRARDPATFKLIWGTPAFLCTSLGYGLIAMVAYAISYWTAPYAESVLHLNKLELAFYIGGGGALGGFLGVILGGRIADALHVRNPAGRILVVIGGSLLPIIPVLIAFTTQSATIFYLMHFVAVVFGSSALGAAAATTQDLVLPRMRGTAAAAFFLATTLVGLSFGPYLVGQISDWTGTIVNGALVGNLRFGMLAMIGASPLSLALLLFAYRLVPAAEASVRERARAAGEVI